MIDLELITKKSAITRCYNNFRHIVNTHTRPGRGLLYIITPGGSGHYPYRHHPQTSLWASQEKRENKTFTAFGFDARPNSSNRMAVQVNFQPSFINFQEAAVWAKDEEDNFYLLHGGHMGGGVKGINKNDVIQLFGGELATLIYNGYQKEFMVVCCLQNSDAFEQIQFFVNQIAKIKPILKGKTDINGEPKRRLPFKLKKYTPEFWGKTSYTQPKRKIKVLSLHGLVVHEVQEIVKAWGEPVKNGDIDLGLIIHKKPAIQFEIKTTAYTQPVYTAIGQLMLHSHRWKKDSKKVIILPSDADPHLVKDLLSLGIHTVCYKWVRQKPLFDRSAKAQLKKICTQ